MRGGEAAMKAEKFVEDLIIKPESKVSLQRDYDPRYTNGYHDKKEAAAKLQADIQRLIEFQAKLYAQSTHALLIILQAIDAAGKDSVIKHVMSGLNPQGCQVHSFKTPSSEELSHDYLWRHVKALPQRGQIGIFNRSYYEEVLVVRVHPEFLEAERLPPETREGDLWQQRFDQINHFEHYLVANGTHVLKFFLNVSKAEQKERFLERIEDPTKNWKFSFGDLKEREHWDEYQHAYEQMLEHTSTDWAPWYVIPADRKWFTRLAVANIIAAKLEELDPEYPTVSDSDREDLIKGKLILEYEDPS
jgi:PPK2 family polyphosphate:nucleotide phosphotransferase